MEIPSESIKKEIQSWIRSCLGISDSGVRMNSGLEEKKIFPALLDRFKLCYEKPATNIKELCVRKTTSKGKYFEVYCCMHLEANGYRAQLLSEIDEKTLTTLGLPRRDVGIDIIASKISRKVKRKNGKVIIFTVTKQWYAIQAKYKKREYRGVRKPSVTWKQLSTFLSLCERTGPWKKRIVMTTCDGVSWKGNQSEKDMTIAYSRFCGTKKEMWRKMCGVVETGNIPRKLVDEKESKDKPSIEELRELRLKYLESKTKE